MEISRRDLSRFKPGPRARIMLTAPKHFGIRLALLLVLQAFWLETSHSELPAGRNLEEEISKQESIFQSQGRNVPRGYTLDRSLLVYTQGLSSGFSAALANLVPADRWLDIGAGMGQAILDYHSAEYDRSHPEGRKRRGRKAQAVAMSIEDRRTPQWRQKAESLGPDRIRYLVGRRLREYSPEELGKFRVITDVAGGFSYTTNLSVFMESVLGVERPTVGLLSVGAEPAKGTPEVIEAHANLGEPVGGVRARMGLETDDDPGLMEQRDEMTSVDGAVEDRVAAEDADPPFGGRSGVGHGQRGVAEALQSRHDLPPSFSDRRRVRARRAPRAR